ncbi:MAG: hypothetical protein AAF220_13170 [Pseudomonadota bacterium]
MESLNAEGVEAMAINSYLAFIGTSMAIEPLPDLDQLIERFDINAFGRATPKFDPDELMHLNPRVLQGTPFDDVQERLAGMELGAVDEPFWLAVRDNITLLRDVSEWWRICRTPLESVIEDEDRQFLVDAADSLPDGEIDADVWSAFVNQVKETSGRKGKALFMPLRKALTGQERGPEIPRLVPLMGRDRVAARLRGETA